MKTYEYVSYHPEDTVALATKLAQYIQPKDVITLEGDLGAGKTTFTKGLAKGLGINRNVSSPTFTIIKQYEGRIPLYHMDVYRLEESEEDLGFDEYFFGDGVTVVEWAHIIEPYLPAERLHITIHHADGGSRIIRFSPIGQRYEQLCKEIFSDESVSD
ncbi:tRNA (adenosine(37)-N6)-threonylcarbamoyltransferase complex ATPase subunit type 1 TsaE [Anoxybacillus sp. ST4]|uniref:tRNA (adenosine(37)-N6)-threonylcarbamoyltransferase complex ATPase subunit type 1 TsaE n=1 Tax=Anoxybacillus sp. ST4 TaxID=2864181 RepID=UPI001C642AD7|nr:tRNA (adenosine(37)-N6)-threonylcarbamoyltransferase complex ATPase subunit type 1 TsaE [Anoxybacillus sp. ST4]MBW7652211.1 tRNA (adenosine(37)-N6)-threonylcarbamoyltransferase complex ATPase subunit type 1 TsaE [Anoxybacillus sp. ST4]